MKKFVTLLLAALLFVCAATALAGPDAAQAQSGATQEQAQSIAIPEPAQQSVTTPGLAQQAGAALAASGADAISNDAGAASTSEQAQQSDEGFIDIAGHWAEDDIKAAECLGLMNGMGTDEQGNKVFAPDASVNREQLAAVLTRTFALDYGEIDFIEEPLPSDYYRDVENRAWYAESALFCAINNIFDADSSFNPNRSVTRIEVAKAVRRSFDAKGISVPMIMLMPIYQDTTDLEQEEQNAMVFVSNTGIMTGSDGYFRPSDQVNRAELAKIINRCREIITINERTNGEEYQVVPGQPFVLALPSNPSTGCRWTISSLDENCLTVLDECFLGSDSAVAGEGGKQYWRFKAGKQEGATELCLWYGRPWESVQPAETFTLKVNIKSPDGQTSPDIDTRALKSLSQHMNIDLRIPVLNVLEDQEIEAQINERLEQEAFDFSAEVAADLDDYVKNCEKQGCPIWPYEAVSRFQKCYGSSQFLSFYVDYYGYTGGAHGMTFRRAYNFDLCTGRELALKDLFSEDDYRDIIDQEINKQIQAEPGNYFTGESGFNGISDDQGYYVKKCSENYDEKCLVIYFDLYEIAPYAAGFPEFEIPFSVLKDAGIRTDL